jgi:hypothetical protein
MQIQLDRFGRLPVSCPAVFFRVETWMDNRRVADFTTEAEAAAFAIDDAKARGFRYDHKVACMNLR